MKRSIKIFLLITGCVNVSVACQCLDYPAIYEEFDRAGSVFVGKVVSTNASKSHIELQGKDVYFEIDVLKSYKGERVSRVTLNRGSKASSCYSGYVVGKTYLFYTDGKPFGFFSHNVKAPNIVYVGSFCNRITELEYADDQLLFLNEKLKGKAESMIYGSVAVNNSVNQRTSRKYLHNISVSLSGKQNFHSKTDTNGLFRFEGIPPGVYELKIVMDSNHEIVSYPAEWTLTVRPDGTVVRGDGTSDFIAPHKAFYWSVIISERKPK